jgi:hypothetical protein
MVLQTWMRIVTQRVGGISGVEFTTNAAFAAFGSSNLDAQQLTDDFTFVTTGPAGSGVILFDSMQPGQFQFVFNRLAGALKVYPPSGGNIDALAKDAPYSLPHFKAQMFTCADATPQIYSLQLG